jgi:hypothetical protein
MRALQPKPVPLHSNLGWLDLVVRRDRRPVPRRPDPRADELEYVLQRLRALQMPA